MNLDHRCRAFITMKQFTAVKRSERYSRFKDVLGV